MDFTGKYGHICLLMNRNPCEFKDLTSFPGGSAIKNPPASAGGMGSIPGLGRSLEEEMATHPSILVWRIPWIEEPGELQSMGPQRVGHN